MRTAIEHSLRLQYPYIRIIEESVNPVLGAFWRARQGE
jgi:hypothetical protein